MRAKHSIHLLIAVTILFSQIVSGIHMAGHVHGPAGELAHAAAEPAFAEPVQVPHSIHLSAAEHVALHRHLSHVSGLPDSSPDQTFPDGSCTLYHVYSGTHCVTANSAFFAGGTALAPLQPLMPSPAPLAPYPEHHSIRGPPTFS